MKIPLTELKTLADQYDISPELAPPSSENEWHLCRYFAFYDVPNAWVGYYRNDYILAIREFNDGLDDFPTVWRVFSVAPFSARELFEFQFADFKEQEFLEELSVSALRFHRTRPRNYEHRLYFAWFCRQPS